MKLHHSRLAVGITALALAALATGCGGGGGGNKSACNKLKATVTNASKNMSTTNTTQLGQQYKNTANEIRKDAEGGNSDLKSAAGRLADTFDSLGNTLTSGSTTLPDTSGLSKTGSDLQKICGN